MMNYGKEIEKLKKLKDLSTDTDIRKMMAKHRMKWRDIDKDMFSVLRKATVEELDVLCFMIDITNHIDAFVFDCLIRLKKLNTAY